MSARTPARIDSCFKKVHVLLYSFVACLLLTAPFSTPAFAGRSSKSGMPLPWPFPWAKECAIDWEALAGSYVLQDSVEAQFLDLTVTVLLHDNYRLIRVSRYDQSGVEVASGFSVVTNDQRSLRMRLQPFVEDEPTMVATIRLYYRSRMLSCSQEELVPILGLASENPNEDHGYFKMVKMNSGRRP